MRGSNSIHREGRAILEDCVKKIHETDMDLVYGHKLSDHKKVFIFNIVHSFLLFTMCFLSH